MTDRENFLERWSRKKIEAHDEAPADAQRETPEAARDSADAAARTVAAPPGAPPQAPEFDIASLPSIESITAATDVRAFLQAGVPRELTRAALRRAWAADPAIRDFIGLQENGWDFNDPNGIPGFGRLAPDADIGKLVAQVFGEQEEKAAVAAIESPSNAQAAPTADESEPTAASVEPSAPSELSPVEPGADGVQRNNNIAMQNSFSEVEPEQAKPRRHHGGALPK